MTELHTTHSTKPTTGFFPDIPEDAYHADRDTLSSTGARHLLRSPAHYRAYLDEPRTETPALKLGKALHALALEGREAFTSRFAIRPPDLDGRTKAGKEWIAANEDMGLSVLSVDDGAAVLGMAESLGRHPAALKLLHHGHTELTGYWQDAGSGAPCRLRADYARVEDGIFVDLKTTQDARQDAFQRSIHGYGYHIQAAHYGAGFRAITGETLPHFVFVVVEKSPPYAVGVYRLDDAAMAEGRRLLGLATRTYAECRERGEWPAYAGDIEEIGLPRWALPQEEF